ncbi:hypothetical protein [Rhodohalobacter sp. 8-1]|uniref:hypothetical protein n=1 Tax=Rhodohalobacter sp. 8-1 TaxID=3131972 RepID=UPI0030ECCB3E
MNAYFKSSSYLSLILLFVLAGCGDDSSTNTGQTDPPDVPEAIPAEINKSVFENNNPVGEEFALFNEAAILAQTASAQINGGTALGQSYLEFTRSRDADFQDGTWTWSFSSNENGVDVSVRTTAEQLQDGFQWNIFISGTFNGESVAEFQFLSGFISENGNSGNWRYFSPNSSDQPILEYQWDVISETESSFTSIFRDTDGSINQQIEYVRNGADNTLEYTGFSSNDLVLYWNSETKAGYIDREGEDRRCWDESFAETACS